MWRLLVVLCVLGSLSIYGAAAVGLWMLNPTIGYIFGGIFGAGILFWGWTMWTLRNVGREWSHG